jgi:tetratricopeptide (TPR) repeat protein
MQQFIALGYIEKPSANQEEAVENCIREATYNLAQVYLDSYRPLQALPLLEKLTKEKPDEIRFNLHLGQCYLDLGRLAQARHTLEGLTQRGDRPWADWLMGIVYFQENDFDQALLHLSRAAQAEPRLPDLHLRLGNTYLRMRRFDEAEQSFQRAAAIDGDSPAAHLGLAQLRLRRRKNEQAAEEALAAVGLQHFLPMGHYCLGVALSRIGRLDRAELAFQTALSMAPGMLNAHRWLIALYRSQGTNFDKIAKHRLAVNELQKQGRFRVRGRGLAGA